MSACKLHLNDHTLACNYPTTKVVVDCQHLNQRYLTGFVEKYLGFDLQEKRLTNLYTLYIYISSNNVD